MKQSRLNDKDTIGYYRSRFAKEQTFTLAREIWLYCTEYNIDVPQDVFAVFKARIQKEHDRDMQPQKHTKQEDYKTYLEDLEIYNFVTDCEINGLTQVEAFDRLKKMMALKGVFYSSAAIKQKFIRFRHEVKKYG